MNTIAPESLHFDPSKLTPGTRSRKLLVFLGNRASFPHHLTIISESSIFSLLNSSFGFGFFI